MAPLPQLLQDPVLGVGHQCWAWDLLFTVFCIPDTIWVRFHWREIIFCLQVVVSGRQSWESIWHRPVHAATVCMSSCLRWSLKAWAPWCPPSPPALPNNSLSPWRRDLMETSHLGLSVSRPLLLCPSDSCGSLYVFSPTQEERRLSTALLYESSRMSSGVVLLLRSFSRAVVSGFSLGPWFIRFQVPGHPSSAGYGFYPMEWT